MLPSFFTDKYLRKLELLNLRSRKKYLSIRQGIHSSLKRGHGLEFSDYRKYEPGDDPRHIDWGVYARSEKIYVKKFTEEQSISLTIFLDCSASMKAQNTADKFDFACNLALSLAYIALMQGDAVQIIIPGIASSIRTSSARGIHDLANFIKQSANNTYSEFAVGSSRMLGSLRTPGIAIFISDFLFENSVIRNLFSAANAKNLDSYAIQILGAHDLNPEDILSNAEAQDSETGEILAEQITTEGWQEYQKLLAQHNKALLDLSNQLNIRMLQTSSANNLESLMTKELPKMGLLLT